ncbi:MAG: M28 family peptidase [Pseudomonadota bacterium]
MDGLFEPSTARKVETHVTLLASDDFGGRGTGSAGYDKAADYIAGVYTAGGVAPALPGFRQPVPLVAIDPDSVSGSLAISAGGEDIVLEVGESVGFFPPSDGVGDGYRAEAAGQVVFVGDGVYAPSLGMDPYAGVDVRGKIVAMFSGAAPIEDRATEVHVRRFDTKRAEAARRGAVGILLLDTQDRSVNRRTGLRASHPEGSLSLGAGFLTPMPAAAISLDVFQIMVEASGRELEGLLDAVEEGAAESFELTSTAVLETKADAVPIATYNVVGVVEGTDPGLRNEAVVVTAHLDHLGTRESRGGLASASSDRPDLIYNGAVDNALGTAIIMEAALEIARLGGSARSIVFAAVTAEEAGLLGSAHLARNVEALGFTPVANVNVDMPVLTYPLNDVIGFGEDYSSLREPFRAAAAAVGLEASYDPVPEMSLFVRSDHYRFVQEGIPALFLFNGMTDEGLDGFQEFMRTNYHRPTDQVDLPINWQDAEKLTDMTVDLVQRIANNPDRPQWDEGVVFAPSKPQG